MKALVTGSGGFVGPHLCRHLAERGDEVVGADRRGEAVRLDVTDRDSVHAVLAEVRPDVVYHLAALSHVGDSWADPRATLRVNVEGTANVLDAARAAGAGRVLVVGSAEEYGVVRPDELPVGEDTPLRPHSPYGASKVAASFLALQAWLGAGLETIRVRAFNHTGPGQRPDFVVAALARRVASAEQRGDEEIPVGNLDPVREVNDVRDVVRAYRMLMLQAPPGEVYNVGSGVGYAVGDIAARLLALAERPLRLLPDPTLSRPADIPKLVCDPARLQGATGWRPEIPLATTLADVLAEARAATP